MIVDHDNHAVVVDLAAVLRRPGTRRDAAVDLVPDEHVTSVAAVARILGTLVAESHGEKVGVSGILDVEWQGECRRCLEVATGHAELEIREIYEKAPVEGETYRLPSDTQLDLAPMVLEQALLVLPLAPLCGESCAGPAPDVYPTAPVADVDDDVPAGDPRWAALDALQFEDTDREEH